MSDFKAKCTKFSFRWGSAIDPAVEAYNRSVTALPQAVLNSLLLRDGRGREGKRKRRGRKGKGEGRREEVEGKNYDVVTVVPLCVPYV